MHKLSFLLITLFITGAVGAQSIRVAAGKKFKVVSDAKTISGTSVMGQQMDASTHSTSITEYEIKTVNANGYTLVSAIKRITGSLNVMGGQEQNFDSDDESSRNNPEMADAFKMIDQKQEVTVDNGKTVNKGEGANLLSQISGGTDNLYDAAKLILSIPVNQLKEGYHWSDSSFSAESDMISQYTITKTGNAQVEITVNIDLKINGTIKQAGMEIKQKMQGTTTAIRLYNMVSGLLISEKSSVDMTGSAEMMGMNVPVTVKGTIETTVE